VTHVAMMPARRWTSAIVVLALSTGLSVADPINPRVGGFGLFCDTQDL
jgi:hypothetical protein